MYKSEFLSVCVEKVFCVKKKSLKYWVIFIGGIEKLRIRRDAEEGPSEEDDIESMQGDEPAQSPRSTNGPKYADEIRKNVKELGYNIK